MALSEVTVMKVEITPNELAERLSATFCIQQNVQNPRVGFRNKLLQISTEDAEIAVEISYDGESELLAITKAAPQHISEETIEKALMDYFDVASTRVKGQADDSEPDEEEGDDDEEDDEDEDEDEGITPEEAITNIEKALNIARGTKETLVAEQIAVIEDNLEVIRDYFNSL